MTASAIAAWVVGRLGGGVTPRVVKDDPLIANARRSGSIPRPQLIAVNEAITSSAQTPGRRDQPKRCVHRHDPIPGFVAALLACEDIEYLAQHEEDVAAQPHHL